VDPAFAQRVVTLLSVLVAIDYADRTSLGAIAPDLRDDLGISAAELGLVGGAFSVVGGLAALIAGALVDRVPRLRLLGFSALAWSVAMLATGVAQNLLWLLLARASLGIVLATVGPAYPSLVGDVETEDRRSVALGRIAIGQLLGGAAGIALGAASVHFLDWRATFLVLAAPAVVVAVLLLRTAEPMRTEHHDDQPPWGAVVRLLLHTPTVLAVLLSASVGNYYLAGSNLYAVSFAKAHYGVSTAVADIAILVLGAGAVLGIVWGSRLSDRLVALGAPAARLRRCAQAYVVTALAWLPALLVPQLLVALPFLVVGSAALAATLPVLDAVRVDLIPAPMRGRAEAVRTVLRAGVEGLAPLLFGVITDVIGNDDRGLQVSFLTALPSIVAAGWLLQRASHTYDADAARKRPDLGG
jgi:predicted MFS family arabinose efflux permease